MKKSICILLIFVMALLSACAGNANVQEDTTQQTQTVSQPEKQYITVGGKQRQLVGTVVLDAGYTRENVVQFKRVHDFGLRDERPLGFSGEILLNGEKLSTDEYRFDGYEDNDIIALKLFRDKLLTDNVLTVMADSIIYYDQEAVLVTQTFQAMWDSEKWTDVQQSDTAQ